MHTSLFSKDVAGGKKKKLTQRRKTCCERFSRRSKQEIAISRLDSERIRAIITVKSGFVPFVPLRGVCTREGDTHIHICILVIKIELAEIRFKIERPLGRAQ